MTRSTRRHLRISPALLVAVVALVFAMTGGAWAVTQHPHHQPKAKVGKRGPRGATGAVGVQGPKGDQGATGEPGSATYSTSLPSGRTEVGVFAVRFASNGGGSSGEGAISFSIPLASAPSLGRPAECTGTASVPTAPPGEFCLYVGQGPTPRVLSYFEVSPSGEKDSLSRFGGAINVASKEGSSGDILLNGTWAVKAP